MKRKREYSIEILEQKYNLQRNPDNNKIKVIPLSQHSFQTYPLNKSFIEVTDEEFVGLVTRKKQFNKELTQLVDFVHIISEVE